jgi:hypothetical protein
MNDQELRSSPFPDTWDNTMRQMAASCPRKLYFFLRGFDYASRPAYFVWGSAWEEIMATWYSRAHLLEHRSPEWAEHVLLSLNEGLRFWDETGVEDRTINKRSSFEPIFMSYLEHYPIEEWSLVEEGAEAGWTYPLLGTDWFLGGSLDGYIEWPSYGMLALENKTDGGYLTDNYVSSWSFSGQVTGYIWYLTKILGEQNVFGCLMNMVTKNVPGPRSRWTTPRFKRSLEKRSPIQLAEFEEQWAFEIHRFKRDFWDRWYWPMAVSKDECAGGTGKAPCLFKAICSSDSKPTEALPSIYPGIVEREGRWEPWNRSGKQEE